MKDSFRDIFYQDITDQNKIYYLSPFIETISFFLEENREKYKKILDFGCGYGEFSSIFSKSGFDVTGIDADNERIIEAKRKFPCIDFMNFSFTDLLPFPDNSVDIIFSNSVLQYINHELFFNECKRVLRKGGCIIFIENLKNNPITKIGRSLLKYRKYNYQSYPWNHLTITKVRQLDIFFNLKVLNTHHILGPLLYIPFFKPAKSIIKKIDQIALKLPFTEYISWMVLVIGKI